MRKLRATLRNQHGFTLVLMTFMLTVLIGTAAFGVDFGRMYMYRAELHASADAGALSSIQRVMRGDYVGASDAARA